MAQKTHPEDGFIIHEDGSADVFLTTRQKRQIEENKKKLARIRNKTNVFSADATGDGSGFANDFVTGTEAKLDSEANQALEPKDHSDDITIGELVKQLTLGSAFDVARNTGELITDSGQRLRDSKVEDVFNVLEGVVQGLDPVMTSEGQLHETLPEGALGEFGQSTIQEILDGIHPTLGGKIPFDIPEIEPQGGAGVQFMRGFNSFFVGFTALKAMGIARNTFAATVGSDVLSTDAEQNLANLFNQMSPELANPLSEFLEAKIDDSELEQRLKQAGIGVALGVPFEVVRQFISTARQLRDAGVKSADLLKPQQALGKLAAHNQRLAKKSRGETVEEVGDGIPQPVNPKTAVTIQGQTFDIDGIDKFVKAVNSERLIKKALQEAEELISSRQVGNTGLPVRYSKEAIAEARQRMQKDPIGETKKILQKDPRKGITDVDPIIMEIVYGAHHLQAKALAEELAKTGAYDSGAFLQAHTLSLLMAQQRRQLSATASRTLSVRKELKDFELDQATAIGEAVEDMGVLPPGISERDLINNYVLLSKEALAKSHTQAAGPGMKDAILKLYYFNLLSGLDTQVGNILGGMLNLTFQTAARQLAGKMRGTLKFFGSKAEGVDEDEGANLMFGLVSGFRRQLPILARNIYRTIRGQDIDIHANTKLEGVGQKPAIFSSHSLSGDHSPIFKAVVDQIGAPLEGPGRFLMSFDQLFRGAAFDAANHATALRKAKADGLVGEALKKRTQFYLDHPTPEVLIEANKFANMSVFLDELGPIAGGLNRGLDNTFVGRLFIPFLKVLVNIAKAPVRNNLITGPLTPHQLGQLRKGGVDRDIAIGQMMAGTGLIMAALAFSHGQGIVGTLGAHGPTAQARRRQNQTPCSFRVKQSDGAVRDIGFNNLAPVGQFFCATADYYRIAGQITSGEQMDLAKELMDSTRKVLLNATFAQNIIQIADALEAQNFKILENLVAGMIPASNIVSDVQRLDDKALRDTRTIGRKAVGQQPGKKGLHEPFYEGFYQKLNRIVSRLPGLSKDLSQRHNLWGEPIFLEGGLGPDLVSPIYTSTEVDSPIDKIIENNQTNVTMPPDNFRGVLLEPEELQEWIVKAGKPAKKFLDELYANGAFDNLSDGSTGGKSQLILAIVNSFREQAMQDMLADPKHEDLRNFLIEHELEKAMQKHPIKVN